VLSGLRSSRALVTAAFCIALALASLLAPSAPTTDPWGWIVWGREALHLDLSTVVGGPPSWKPLPVLLTAPLALFGSAAPTLWLLVSRALGLLGLVFAYRLGRRLAGPAAGVVAAALPALVTRSIDMAVVTKNALARAKVENSLAEAVARVGAARLRACGNPVLPRGMGWLRGEVAWRLGLPLDRAQIAPPGTWGADLVLFGRHSREDGELTTLARAGRWRLAVPEPAACAGGDQRSVQRFDQRHKARQPAPGRPVRDLVVPRRHV
jgi:hypothetical protein